MKHIKLFVPNENGKIELTKEELENLLNEAYEEGASETNLRTITYGTGTYPVINPCDGKDYYNISTTPYKDTTTTISNKLDAEAMSRETPIRKIMMGVQ